jgi:hypothetical protein
MVVLRTQSERDRWLVFAATLPLPLAVEAKPHKPRRSDEANRYLWGCVYEAFRAALPGWDKDDIHEYLLGECFGWETIEGMGRKRLKPVKRSSRLNKADFAAYVDFCIRKGAEHGVFVPEADHA